MFWYLYFAHFIADYPLQPGWLVEKKRTWWGLTLHVTIHFIVMMIIVGSARITLLPYLLGITAVHFLIDAFKNFLFNRRPQWVIWPYFNDQLLHLLTILAATYFILLNVPESQLPPPAVWPIYGTGLILGTYVWVITERILFYKDPEYQQELSDRLWTRMLTRAVFMGLLLWAWQAGTRAFAVATVLGIQVPYVTGDHRGRALWIDIGVAFACAILVQIGLILG